MQLNERVDIDLLDDIALAHDLRDGRDVLAELLLVQRGLSAETLQHLLRLQAVQRRGRLLHARGAHVEHHVLQNLHHHAAEARHGDGAEGGVAVGADHHLQALRHHLAHHDAVVLDRLLAELRVHRLHHAARRLAVLDVQRHAAHVRLVDDLRFTRRFSPHVGRHHLRHELARLGAELLLHEVAGLLAAGEQLVRGRLDAAQREHVVALDLRQRRAALLQRNSKIAKMNTKGVIKGLKKGKCKITLTSKDGSLKTKTINVTVK